MIIIVISLEPSVFEALLIVLVSFSNEVKSSLAPSLSSILANSLEFFNSDSVDSSEIVINVLVNFRRFDGSSKQRSSIVCHQESLLIQCIFHVELNSILVLEELLGAIVRNNLVAGVVLPSEESNSSDSNDSQELPLGGFRGLLLGEVLVQIHFL